MSRSVVFRSVLCAALWCVLVDLGIAQTVFDLGPGQVITSSTPIPNGSTINVNGGTIGFGVDLSNGTLNINSGNVAVGASSISQGFTNINNEVQLSGGNVGGFFQLRGSTELNVTGGTIESFGLFESNTVANIIGGEVTRFPDLLNGTLNIIGGEVFSLRAFGGTANIFGSDFALNGVPIDGLVPGEAFTVNTRNVQLTATLTDGSPFETDLNTSFGGFGSTNPDGASTSATINLHFVLPGDFDSDNDVDGQDFLTLQREFGSGGLDADDLARFRENFGVRFNEISALGSASLAVPEPSSLVLLLMAAVFSLRRSVRSRLDMLERG